MKKLFLFVTFVLWAIIINAQSDKASKVARYIEKYSFPVTNSEGRCIVKYNSEVTALTIDNYRFLLKTVHVYIKYSEGYYCVAFNCKSGNNCIVDPNGVLRLEFAVPFANRERCEGFISIINEL
jgi:hypothetical protein